MNRRARRAAAARGITESRVASTHVDLHCAGPLSEPPQNCTRSLVMAMPFTGDDLFKCANATGWYMTLVTPVGEVPARCAVLCSSCAEAVLDPALLAAARQRMPGSA